MSKKDKKNEKDQHHSGPLSAWQELNKSYLERKAKEAQEEEKDLAQQKQERMGDSPKESNDEEELEEDAASLDDESIAAKHRRKQAQKRLENEKKLKEEQEDIEDPASNQESEEDLKEDSEESAEAEVEKKRSKKEERALKRAAKKQARLAKKSQRKISRRHIVRVVPILILAFSTFLLSLYFMTPLSTSKNFQVSGNNQVDQNKLLEAGLFDRRDYTLTTLLNKDQHARNIKASDPWLEKVAISYSFPNKFQIGVKEYDVVAYFQDGDKYHPILSNGYQIEKTLSVEEMPESFILVNIKDEAIRHDFVKNLAPLSANLKASILEVKLTPSKATKDLLTILMADGNKVLVPLSELQKKLPYYSVIKEKLEFPSIVDMEAGAFSYSLEKEKKEEKESNSNEEEDSQDESNLTETRSETGLAEETAEPTSTLGAGTE